MRAYVIASLSVLSCALVLGSAGGCSSGSGGGNAVPCTDAGTCAGGMVCRSGFCVLPGAGGSGGAGTGGSGGGGSLCSAACAKGAQAKCPSFSLTACEADCATQLSNTPAKCQTAYQAALVCAATATYTCDQDGDAQMVGCEIPFATF